jgi:negative regulator of sigma-B (phosphoserine phosphatase)
MPMLEYGIAQFALPGQGESGDKHLVRCKNDGVLVAAIDGLGHGEEAANASRTAVSILKEATDEPPISLVEKCHEALRSTRGVVLSLAFFDPEHRMMTWLGIGNVQGVLMRENAKRGEAREVLLLRAGLVGAQLPPLQATVLRVCNGDTLFFATDGIRSDFMESLSPKENPQRAANRILEEYRSGSDDALVLVVRLTGIRA